jgi:hypothetical protein
LRFALVLGVALLVGVIVAVVAFYKPRTHW